MFVELNINYGTTIIFGKNRKYYCFRAIYKNMQNKDLCIRIDLCTVGTLNFLFQVYILYLINLTAILNVLKVKVGTLYFQTQANVR